MKRILLFSMLVALLFATKKSYAQFDNPTMGLGFSAGGAQGNNSSTDKWVVQFRGHFQYNIGSPYVLGQLNLGYMKLKADVYQAEIGLLENRFLLIPFSMKTLNPFFYTGFGVAKDIGKSGSEFLPMIPLGISIQTWIGSQMLLEFSGGYNLVLSDKLDGRQRTNSSLNSLSNGKHDGFYGFLLGLTFTMGSNEDADPDKDGLTNKDEEKLGTDPENPDTDGDGLKDGGEVNQYRTDPLNADSDADGLKDGAEVNQYKSDPLNTDSDGDGLKDGAEVNQYKTDPLMADTDDDGLNDGPEVNKYKTDPLKADSDGDGLNDGAEMQYKSDPLKADSDSDGLSDGVEVNQYKTDPAKADTDGDGLSDGDEVNKYKSDPLKSDTDGGGMADGAEVKSNTNPLDPKDDITSTIILEKGKKVILKGVNFETNKATLTIDSKDILEEAYKALIANPDIQVEISGHTDNVGSDTYNQDLSLRRAQAVKNWLTQRGIAGNRMKTVGKGEMEPVADNSTSKGRAENRRIEFFVL
jgi:outer membrane protein OmpA-like peptidoglycan-associated protein